jgi:hypothetical protein
MDGEPVEGTLCSEASPPGIGLRRLAFVRVIPGIFATFCLAVIPAWAALHGDVPRMLLFFPIVGCAFLFSAWCMGREQIAARQRRIIVDYASRTVRFEHVRLEHNFRWPSRPVPEITVGFEEILSTERVRNSRGPDALWIVIPQGRVTVSQSASNFEELAAFMAQHAAGRPPFLYSELFVWLLVSIAFAGVIGLLLLAIKHERALDAILRWLDKPL